LSAIIFPIVAYFATKRFYDLASIVGRSIIYYNNVKQHITQVTLL